MLCVWPGEWGHCEHEASCNLQSPLGGCILSACGGAETPPLPQALRPLPAAQVFHLGCVCVGG